MQVFYLSRMPQLKKIEVKEGLSLLQKLYKRAAHHLRPRLKMLILSLQQDLHSERQLAPCLKVSANSVQAWKRRYAQGGLKALLHDRRRGNRPSKIDPATHQALEAKLSNAKEAPRSFTELQQWVEEHYMAGINYQTLRGYVQRHFGAKIKIVRKTHYKKDEDEVAAFKKNSLNN